MADSKVTSIASSSFEKAAGVDESPIDERSGTHVVSLDEKREINDRSQQLKKLSTVEAAQAELTKTLTGGDDIEYPKGAKLALITLALCLSVFLVALDNTIIATAIPKITDHFNSLPDVQWYGSAYLLTTAAFQLLFGKIYTYFSIKWVYLTAIGIFELGSLICGVAPTSTALIVGRAIAGLGSAGLFSGALIIVAYAVPLQKRPIYTGIIGAMYGIASVAGPLLGGVFTDKATWRWVITIIVILLFFKSPERAAVNNLGWRARIKELDLLGTGLFMPAVVCLLLALQWGGTKYAWSEGRIIALFVVFGILIIGFIGVQFWRQDSATVPPRIVKQRSIWSACWFAFCLGGYFFLLIYYLPIYFQAVKGASAVKSGIMNLPLILSLVVTSILAGVFVTVVGYYTPLMILSSIVATIGVGLLYTFTPHTGHAKWIGYQALAGIGVGMGMQQALMAVQTVLDLADVPVGTSVLMFLQTLGGALFVSVGGNVFNNKLVSNLAKYVPSIDPQMVLSTGATSIQKTIDKASLAGVTLAYSKALTQTYLVALILSALSITGAIFVEWRSVKGKQIGVAAA